MAGHPPEAADHIANSVVAHVAHVQRARRVRQHRQAEILGLVRQLVDLEGTGLAPEALGGGFDGSGGILGGIDLGGLGGHGGIIGSDRATKPTAVHHSPPESARTRCSSIASSQPGAQTGLESSERGCGASARGESSEPPRFFRGDSCRPMLLFRYCTPLKIHGDDQRKDFRGLHETQQPPSWRRGMSTRQSILRYLLGAMLSISIAGCATVRADDLDAQPKSLLDRIWPYSLPSKRPLSKRDQEYAEAAFIQWLEAHLRQEYEVIDQRFFWDRKKSDKWVAISKGHALYPENENGRWRVLQEIREGWRNPGFDLVRMWKVKIDGSDHYFAIAMTKYPVPGAHGRRLIGRFELKKVVE